LEEAVGRLEKDYGIDMHIADKIFGLEDEYRERLYQDLTD